MNCNLYRTGLAALPWCDRQRANTLFIKPNIDISEDKIGKKEVVPQAFLQETQSSNRPVLTFSLIRDSLHYSHTALFQTPESDERANIHTLISTLSSMYIFIHVCCHPNEVS